MNKFRTPDIPPWVMCPVFAFERQREADTLPGYLRQLEHQALVSQHQAAQRLLEPLTVINPYAPQLRFPAHSLRARRAVLVLTDPDQLREPGA